MFIFHGVYIYFFKLIVFIGFLQGFYIYFFFQKSGILNAILLFLLVKFFCWSTTSCEKNSSKTRGKMTLKTTEMETMYDLGLGAGSWGRGWLRSLSVRFAFSLLF